MVKVVRGLINHDSASVKSAAYEAWAAASSRKDPNTADYRKKLNAASSLQKRPLRAQSSLTLVGLAANLQVIPPVAALFGRLQRPLLLLLHSGHSPHFIDKPHHFGRGHFWQGPV